MLISNGITQGLINIDILFNKRKFKVVEIGPLFFTLTDFKTFVDYFDQLLNFDLR